MARLLFRAALKRIAPPWLQRSVGGRFMTGLGSELDTELDRNVEGVKLRFPDAVLEHASALAKLGRERRIRRGPGEDAETYARRLAGWWDDHRARGGPYALLRQLYEFFLAWLNVRMDVVAYSGLRHWIDSAGVITRDSITWEADGVVPGPSQLLAANASPGHTEIRPVSLAGFPTEGPYVVRLTNGSSFEDLEAAGTSTTPYNRIVLNEPVVGSYPAGPSSVLRPNLRWAAVWVFFYLTDTIPLSSSFLVTQALDFLITQAGDFLLSQDSIAPDEISAAELEVFLAIPREWSAAHVGKTTVVLLWGTRRLWQYPQPVPTWTAWGASGAKWGEPPVVAEAA